MRFFFLDEDLDVEITIRILRSRYPEHTFDLADNLEDCKTLIYNAKYDVLVLDIMLPANNAIVPRSGDMAGLLTGLLLRDLIKADRDCINQKTPIVLFTGLIVDEDPAIKNAQKQCGKFFLQKP